MILSVCGTQRNVGVTYFCLALSNYLCNMEQRQVAYLEVNATGEISAISGKSALQPGKTNFSHKGIHFYPQVTLDKLWELLRLSYDFFVLDFGTLSPLSFREYVKADYYFIVGHCTPWKLVYYHNFFQKYKHNWEPEKTICLEALGTKKSICKPSDQLPFRVRQIPFLEDPFYLASQDWEFYQELVKSIIPRNHFTIRKL